jgi:hypothetical protein
MSARADTGGLTGQAQPVGTLVYTAAGIHNQPTQCALAHRRKPQIEYYTSGDNGRAYGCQCSRQRTLDRQRSLAYPENQTMISLKHFPAFFLIAMLALFVGCASTAQQEGTGEYIDDTVLTTKVKAAIFNEPTLKSAEINVETFKGEVQLSGFVNSQADINRAVEVARSVQGVKSVRNDMRVK